MPYDEDRVPPVIRLLLSEEKLFFETNEQTLKAFKKIIPECRRQAVWSAEHFDYSTTGMKVKKTALVIMPTGAINPLSTYGICDAVPCRLKGTLTFAQTFGLYAEQIVLEDTVTSLLLRNSRFTLWHYDNFIKNALVVRALKPFILSGLVRFVPGEIGLCIGCATEARKRIEQVSEALLPDLLRKIDKVERRHGQLIFRAPDPSGQMLYHRKTLTPKVLSSLKKSKSPIDFLRDDYAQHFKSTVFDMMIEQKVSTTHKAALFSSSRLHVRTLEMLEGRGQDSNIAQWEDARGATLPWISQLSPQQIIHLRDEAHDALPRFRARIATALNQPGNNADEQVRAVAAQLREEAEEVAAELSALRKSKSSLFRNTAGITLTMGFALYAAAAGSVEASAASLLSLLAMLHPANEATHAKKASLKTRPGYVLVKAKEFLEHA